MKLITEVFEDLIVESKGKELFIEGVFLQSNIKNRNGREYPAEIMDKEVERYNEKYVQKNRAFGELGHPEGPSINLERVSHMIKSLKKEGNNYVGKAKIMTETPYGKIVKNLIQEGASLGVSSRGMGSVKESGGKNIVQDDFYLATAADIVADPSAPDAFVNGIMEGKEWVWDNGIMKESQVSQYKYSLDNKKRIETEKLKIDLFEDFMSKL
jgi:hypothetical protein|tara:strand:+ start:1504 stop:2139 length:636 start_codon:yes stop_codon:yes gene_type:complete